MSQHTEDLIQWSSVNHLSLISPIGEPIHDRSNTLDLTWASETLLQFNISTQITDNLHTTSDHCTLLTHIHLGTSPRLPKLDTTHYYLDTTDKATFFNALEAMITYSQSLANEATNYNDEI